MKAVIWTAYGPPDVLKVKEIKKPVPKDSEILVKVMATTVTAGDCEVRSLAFPLVLALPMRFYAGFSKPTRVTILGQELAGEIEAVGKHVTRFKAGDQVFGGTGFGMGTYAQYVALPADSDDLVLAKKPAALSYEEAAAIPTGGLEALHFLRKGDVQRGQKLLINGAGGSIGTFAVQLAKLFGADVTAVDSASKLDLLQSIGADRVIDYTKEDFTESGETYDVIFDVVGKSPFSSSVKALKPGGRYLIANPRASLMLRGFWTSRTSDKDVIFELSGRTLEDLIYLGDLAAAGKIMPVIDRRYPLVETAEAHRYVETGQKQGSLIIEVTHPS